MAHGEHGAYLGHRLAVVKSPSLRLWALQLAVRETIRTILSVDLCFGSRSYGFLLNISCEGSGHRIEHRSLDSRVFPLASLMIARGVSGLLGSFSV